MAFLRLAAGSGWHPVRGSPARDSAAPGQARGARGPHRCGNRPSYSNIGDSSSADMIEVLERRATVLLGLPLRFPR
jgi:hypothetical protein